MRKEVEIIGGNLLDFPTHCVSDPDKHVGINVIAHSCNCQNVMGAGIAKQIKDRYPQAFEADTERWSNEYTDGGNWRCQIGDYSKWTNFDSNVYHATIYNLYTQSGYSTKKREVNYEYFWKAMKAMQEDLLFIQHETGTPRVLGLPYGISCGLAGGNWKIIKAIIEDIFLDSMIQCYIVKYDDLGLDSPADWQKSSFERVVKKRKLHEK